MNRKLGYGITGGVVTYLFNTMNFAQISENFFITTNHFLGSFLTGFFIVYISIFTYDLIVYPSWPSRFDFGSKTKLIRNTPKAVKSSKPKISNKD